MLQMYGNKVEEADELQLDLQDVKDMYKGKVNLHREATSKKMAVVKTLRMKVKNVSFCLSCFYLQIIVSEKSLYKY